ncbi:hypothetical protein Cgig2_028587 [Carnegiea gigantea]|uniref:Uncharacterized protein n=1 Tax=Carnegiea gigantea TaxID=171969 RepID=A0A9Q1Q8M7_9CARY|nr:hypothetical protein Cgig2_028587 [Carnegiea gigantea]
MPPIHHHGDVIFFSLFIRHELIVCPLATPLDLVTTTLHNKPSIDVMQNIMNLSNDESNFGYEEINETIPIDSHVQEDFIIEDDGIIFQVVAFFDEYVIKAGHEGNKCQLYGIKDPKIIVAKGVPKGKRQRTSGKCHNTGHTQRTCPFYVGTKPCTINLECSPVDPLKNDSTNSRSARDVEYSEEVAKLKKNHCIVDWFPKADW